MGHDAHGRSVVALDLFLAVGPLEDGHGSDAVKVGLLPFKAGVGEMRGSRVAQGDFASSDIFARGLIAPIDSIAVLDGGDGAGFAGTGPMERDAVAS